MAQNLPTKPCPETHGSRREERKVSITPTQAKTGSFKTLATAGMVATITVGAQTLAAGPALATVWTDWTSRTFGAPGSAAGTLAGIDVFYTGEVASPTIIGGFFSGWQPESS